MKSELYKSPFNFHLLNSNFLNSNFSKWEYRKVEKDSFLVVLRELDLTEKDMGAFSSAGYVAEAAAAADAARVGAALPTHAYWKRYDQSKEEYEKTGKIKGFEVLNIQTREKLWMPHYGLECLKERQV